MVGFQHLKSVVVLKNCEVDMYLKESCFSDCWKVSPVVPVFKHVGESSTAPTEMSSFF